MSIRRRNWIWLTMLASLVSLCAPRARAQSIGTDIAGLNLCLYGDCEARGTYAADPYGFTNPATMPAGTLAFMSRGAFASASYFRLNAGGVGLHIGSPSLTLAADPWVLEFNVIYAEGGGTPRSLPGGDLSLRTRLVRLAAAVDLGRTSLGLTGLSLGLLVGVPGTTSDVRVRFGGFTVAESQETHAIGLTPGIHWRAGERDWLGVGAFLNAERHHESTRSTDPFTGASIAQHGTTNAWFARAGVSVLPGVPLGIADPSTPAGEWLGELRLAADLEYRNISALGEPTRADDRTYFGVDARLLPDAWNPVADYLRVYVLGGVDTDAGWGIGAGLWGNGPLEMLSCNPAYSSRPLAKSLGDRVDIWSATCALVVPL